MEKTTADFAKNTDAADERLNFIDLKHKNTLLSGKCYYSPYKNNSRILMLPVGVVAEALGYTMDHSKDNCYAIIYKSSVFDSGEIMIRYLTSSNDYCNLSDKSLKAFYYFRNKTLLPIDKGPEVFDGVLYAPSGFFKLAFDCEAVADNDFVTLG